MQPNGSKGGSGAVCNARSGFAKQRKLAPPGTEFHADERLGPGCRSGAVNIRLQHSSARNERQLLALSGASFLHFDGFTAMLK
jgi:hypothetical protein